MPDVINSAGQWITNIYPQALKIIRLSDWLDHREDQDGGVLNLVLNNTDDVSLLQGDLTSVYCISIDFPLLADGRGYSQARLLRSRFKFEGDIRAIGVVQLDQLYLMLRSGFSSFQLSDSDSEQLRKTPSLIQNLLTPFSHYYQDYCHQN